MEESQRHGSLPLKNSLARFLHRCNNLRQLTQIHSQLIVSPFLSPHHRSFLISRLLFYLCAHSHSQSPSSLSYATKTFNRIPSPSLFVYNAIIRANSTKITRPTSPKSLILYKRLLLDALIPDSITLPFVLKESSTRGDLITGQSVFVHCLKFGFGSDVYVQNSLINLYCECGVSGDAKKVFDEMPQKDVVSWNSIIIGCLRGGEIDLALGLFRLMPEMKNIITWNSMITGLAQGGRSKEAIEIFYEMRGVGTVLPDKVTIASVLSACVSLGAIDLGTWVHRYLERTGMECDVAISTALINMYGKCGFIEKAFCIFRAIPNKDILAWTAMISVFALHGFGQEAIELFTEMEGKGVRPNAVTFVGLLSACAHCGLVENGLRWFNTMERVYGIHPQVEHYACMVDILGRAGLFDEAEEVIRTMPTSPDMYVWGALLGACQMHGNVELGERVAQFLIDLEPENHVFYIALCDLYAKSGRFDDCRRVRGLMKNRELRKFAPGSSWIEVDGVVYEFSVKGSEEIPMEALENVLRVLSNEMKMEKEVVSVVRF